MVDVGDKTIDLSVSARVNKLNSLLQRKRYIQLLNPVSDIHFQNPCNA